MGWMMIIVGTAGAWKIRTEANARQAIARSIAPRNGALDPNPSNWSPLKGAIMGFDDPRRPVPLPIVPFDPFEEHQVVRGGPDVWPLIVNETLLDMVEGTHSGFAEIDRELPVWRSLPYRNHYVRDVPMFSGPAWQHHSMEIGKESRIQKLYPNFPPD
jgi:hypothetical protein